MRNLLLGLLTLLVLPTLTPGAVLNNGLLAASDTTGTNATVRSVTITGSTNLWAGTLNATNDITLAGVSITNRLNLWTNSSDIVYNLSGNSLYWQQQGTNRFTLTSDANENRLSLLDVNGQQTPSWIYFINSTASSISRFNIGYDDGSGGGEIYMAAEDAGPTLLMLEGDPDYAAMLSFTPSVADGTTPYAFDSSLTHTSGALVEVKNNGTNKFSVGWQGAITLAATTNQVIFGGTNTAPSGSITTPAKWISVQVQGESTVYRIPLYQ